MRLHYVAGTGSAGATDQVSLALPFYAEDTPTTYGIFWNRTTTIGHLYQRGEEVAGCTAPRKVPRSSRARRTSNSRRARLSFTG